MKRLILLLTFIAGMAHAAVWERPAGGYTPTNHAINITKYQTDRANNVAISSVKVDGDLNKAFQGLNDIEARTPPSIVGQAGKYLTNNGAVASWEMVQPVISMTVPSILTASSYPSAISITLNAQAKNTFLAGPVSGTDAVPTMRAIAMQDLSSDLFQLMRAKAPPQISNNATDATNDIDVGAGAFVADNNAYVKITAPVTKQLDNAWVSGTGAGGLFTGSKASNTWYAVFVIASGTTVDAGFDTSASGANAPSGYTTKRRIGWIRTDASGTIMPFTQVGDAFHLTNSVLSYANTNVTNSGVTVSLTAPPLSQAVFRGFVNNNGVGGGGVVIQPMTETAAAASVSAAPGMSLITANLSSAEAAGQFTMPTNSSSQIRVTAGGTAVTFRAFTTGWIDRRGRDD